MSNVYFASDLHFDHRNICHYRTDFTSVDEHNYKIHESILKTVGKRDTLWLLGDCFFTFDSLYFFNEMNKFIGNVNIVLGNHDTDNGERQDVVRYLATKANKIGSMFSYKDYWLTHAPIHPAELRGKKNIHGHLHGEVLPDKNYFNVNVDVCDYEPVNFHDLQKVQEYQSENIKFKQYLY